MEPRRCPKCHNRRVYERYGLTVPEVYRQRRAIAVERMRNSPVYQEFVLREALRRAG